VSKSKHVLKWQVGEHGAGEFPTRTKSQAALTSHVGSFAVWRHACTFHTRDAARFTGATDAERKRLLEEVLELDRVETGYRRARDELRLAANLCTEADHAVELAQRHLDGLNATHAALAGEVEDVPDLDKLRTQGRAIKRQLEIISDGVAELQSQVSGLRQLLGERSHAETIAARQLAKVRELGVTCDACEQAVPGDHRHTITETAERTLSAARTVVADTREALGHAEKVYAEVLTEQTNMRARYDANIAEGRAGVAAQQRNDARQEKLDHVSTSIQAAQTSVEVAEVAAAMALTKHHELTAAAEVLSYRGVRAAMLAGAVSALEDLANDWLGRMGLSGLLVRLSSQSETKRGKVSDKISLDIEGAGGGLGYLAASTGEQRRIDVAMLLALGELAAESRGMSPHSTLFVDELLDGLDDAGQEAAVDMLRELSKTRCVVVITHSTGLMHRLTPDLHLIARDGALS
jgi:DNA repair exonuclease SbcCD ATPase subunit